MTIREYAKRVGFEIVGKLTKKVITREEYDYASGEYTEKRIVFYIDGSGNEYHKEKNSVCIITAEGDCI